MEPVRLNTDSLVPKFGGCKYSSNLPNESTLLLSKGNPEAILNPSRDEQEVEMRTSVKPRNHVKSTFVQVEGCEDNAVENFPLYSWNQLHIYFFY